MTKYKWSYVASGHYSTQDGDWTIHVLKNGAVYKTHPSRATVDVTGSKADRYIESVPPKFHVRGKKRAKPEPDPEEEPAPPVKVTTKPAKKPKKKVTKKQIGEAAKKLAKGAGAIIGTTRAFVTEVGEAEERAYAKRKPSPPKKKAKPKAKPTKEAAKKLAKGAGAIIGTTRAFVTEVGEAEERAYAKRKPSPPKKKAKPKAKPTKEAKPPADVRPTIVRKKKAKPTARREAPTQMTEHPLEYLISGAGALPPTGRRPATRKRREQTLEEYMGF